MSSLLPHSFFKVQDSIKLIESGHFERGFTERERSIFKEDVEPIEHLKKMKFLPSNILKLRFAPYRESTASLTEL